MLKIKDNVDLKELEKFGLTPHPKYPEIYRYVNEYSLMEIEKEEPIWIGIASNNPNVLHNYEDTYYLNVEKFKVSNDTGNVSTSGNAAIGGALGVDGNTTLNGSIDDTIADIIFDLIQAGLVEKVEGK